MEERLLGTGAGRSRGCLVGREFLSGVRTTFWNLIVMVAHSALNVQNATEWYALKKLSNTLYISVFCHKKRERKKRAEFPCSLLAGECGRRRPGPWSAALTGGSAETLTGGRKTEWSRDAGPQTSDNGLCALALHHSTTVELTINTSQ